MDESLNLFGETVTPKKKNKSSKKRTKSDTAYRTISEAAESLGVATHVLRFWETKFPQIQPVKRAGGRRYYRPEDIKIIEQIQTLLHDKGYTIRGVQSLLEGGDVESIDVHQEQSSSSSAPNLTAFITELKTIRGLLD
tara:strand:- start:27652 stop:28065 length:414 start_codon:yes stop_codon:yes gene_type:complete